jgi:hypothetical protein
MGVADRQKLIADAGKKESWRKEEVKVCIHTNTSIININAGTNTHTAMSIYTM